jgi:hypothetical protein
VTQNPKYLEAVEKLRDLVERNKPNGTLLYCPG